MDIMLLLLVFCFIACGLKWLFIEKLEVKGRAKIILLILFLIIIGDDTLAMLSFNIACTKTGSEIIKRRDDQGFYAPDWSEKQAKSYVDAGYSYVEIGNKKDGYFKYGSNGFEKIESPQSAIEVESHTRNWGYKSSIFEVNIVDRNEYNIIAREAIAWTQGGYLLRIIRARIFLNNSNKSCRGPSDKADLNGNLVTAAINHKVERK